MHETAEFEGGGVKIDVMPEFRCWFDIRDARLIRVEFPGVQIDDAGLSLPVEMPQAEFHHEIGQQPHVAAPGNRKVPFADAQS